MRFCALAIILWGLVSASAQAQFKPYNPYDDGEEDFSVPTADGKLRWPSFYKSAATKAKFSKFFAIGICRGTNDRITGLLADNKVDVNELPEITWSGSVSAAGGETVIVEDASHHTSLLVTHPFGLTKLQISGDLPLHALRSGQIVRLHTQVDARGRAAKPLESAELFTAQPNMEKNEIPAGEPRLIYARVTQVHKERLDLLVTAGKVRRLQIPINTQTVVHVSAVDLSAVGAGDEISARGRLYHGPGIPTEQAIFVNEITVIKKKLPGAEAAKEASKNAQAGVAGR